MRPSSIRILLPTLLAPLALGACFQAPERPEATATESSIAALPDPAVFGLGPGDRLRVRVLGNEDLSSDENGQVVTFAGEIHLPLLGATAVAGKSIDQARSEIEQELLEYVREPSVSLEVIEFRSHQFYVVGHVQKPGAYLLDRPITALAGLALAGPSISGANRAEVFLLRHGATGLEVHPFDAETPDATGFVSLAPDDVLLVQRSGSGVFDEEVLPKLVGITGVINSAAYVGLVVEALDDD